MPGIEHPGSTGVIYCSDRAIANGFNYTSSHDWANLGQGAPEVGPLPNAPPRPTTVAIPEDSLEYAPTTGVKGGIKSIFDFRFLIISSLQHSVRPLPTCIITPIDRVKPVNIHMKMSVLSREDVLACRELPLSLEMYTP